VEYIELQGSAEMVTKSELVQRIRDGGQSISDRNLAYYTSAGLIPPAVRVGSRGGVYPAIVVEQLSWVISARSAQVSMEGIKELLPLWRLLVRGRRDERIDLAEVELVARGHELSLEANYRVPYLFSEVFRCVCSECLMDIEWILKDGTTFHHTEDTPLTLTFVVGKVNEDTGAGEVVAWTQMALPNMGVPELGSPTTIMLGVPLGVDVRSIPAEHRRRPRRTQSSQEALPLT
jgi:DNA-binding transcriptional MerR regulator